MSGYPSLLVETIRKKDLHRMPAAACGDYAEIPLSKPYRASKRTCKVVLGRAEAIVRLMS